MPLPAQCHSRRSRLPLTPLLKEETTFPRAKGLRGRARVRVLPGHRPSQSPMGKPSPVVLSGGSHQQSLPMARHGTSLKQGHQDYQPQEQDGRLPQTHPNPFHTSISASQGASGKGSKSPFPLLPGGLLCPRIAQEDPAFQYQAHLPSQLEWHNYPLWGSKQSNRYINKKISTVQH